MCYTPSPTHDERGCCKGYHPVELVLQIWCQILNCCFVHDQSQDDFCSAYSHWDGCEETGICWWVDDNGECEYTTPAPGCCTGETVEAQGFCGNLESQDECAMAAVCTWIATNDPTECEPTRSPTPSPIAGCCATNDAEDWELCTVDLTQDEVGCSLAPECTWIITDDPEECPQPGCCRIIPLTFAPDPGATALQADDMPPPPSFCGTLNSEQQCDGANACRWIVGIDECYTPTPTFSDNGCCRGYHHV